MLIYAVMDDAAPVRASCLYREILTNYLMTPLCDCRFKTLLLERAKPSRFHAWSAWRNKRFRFRLSTSTSSPRMVLCCWCIDQTRMQLGSFRAMLRCGLQRYCVTKKGSGCKKHTARLTCTPVKRIPCSSCTASIPVSAMSKSQRLLHISVLDDSNTQLTMHSKRARWS